MPQFLKRMCRRKCPGLAILIWGKLDDDYCEKIHSLAKKVSVFITIELQLNLRLHMYE